MELQSELQVRLSENFSHVAPNGQFLTGRHVLLGHLQDKYGCYHDRIFEIDIYNVKLVWSDDNSALLTYEEWQSWQQDDDPNEPGNGEDLNTQQFGRLSTCLLAKRDGMYRWIHVHETWLEEETPSPEAQRASETLQLGEEARQLLPANTNQMEDVETVMTGPVLPVTPQNGETTDEDDDNKMDVDHPKEKSKRKGSLVLGGNLADTTDPQEEEFLQASKGILTFEEEKPDVVPNDSTHSSSPTKETAMPLASSSISSDVSKKRHVSPKLKLHAQELIWEGTMVGLTIAGFHIGTSQGPIGDQGWFEKQGSIMEQLSQSNKGGTATRRRLALPEMVFPIAHVAIEGNGIWLSWDATDALKTWAECHRMIAVNSSDSYQGVNVLKSSDAVNWDKRRKHAGAVGSASDSFHYDWSYSTPYIGTTEGGAWEEMDDSGMRMELLTDQSVPILYFDDVVLFEDDLHDNGQAILSVKLRVMPTCAYVLERLYVRVDNVIIRLRETRVLIDFFGRKAKIYRDVQWRECAWDKLDELGLPNTAGPWHHTGRDTSSWQALIRQLPEVEPPDDIPKYSVLEY